MQNFTENINWENAADYIEQFNLNINSLGLSEAVRNGHQDAFSKCQLYTKFKIAELAMPILRENSDITSDDKSIVICGSWIGTMAMILLSYAKQKGISMRNPIANYDLDPKAIEISHYMFANFNSCYAWVADIINDAEKIVYDESQLIINPIIEHLHDTKLWLDILPKGKPVIMTSTNYKKPNDHINISESMNDFVSQCAEHININITLTLGFPIYERYIILGRT